MNVWFFKNLQYISSAFCIVQHYLQLFVLLDYGKHKTKVCLRNVGGGEERKREQHKSDSSKDIFSK